jgi:surface protein
MFSGCSNIEEIDLSGWHTYGITEMYSMFSNCSKLKKLNLSGWELDDNNLRSDEYMNMFSGCSSLTELITRGCNNTANYIFTTAYNNR